MDDLTVLSAVLDEIDGITFETLEGRVAFQKRVYLAQAAGLPLGYGFKWNQYGPYSEELAKDGRRLELAESIRASAKLPFTSEARRVLDRYVEATRDRPGGVTEGGWLELLASMHFLREHEVGEGRSAESINHRLRRLKPHVSATDEVLDEAWRRIEMLFARGQMS